MIEIAIVITFGLKLKDTAKERNRSGWYGLLFPLFWFGAQFLTGFMAGLTFAFLDKDPNFLLLYLAAIVGGGLGGLLSFKIVKNLEIYPAVCIRCQKEFNPTCIEEYKCPECSQ